MLQSFPTAVFLQVIPPSVVAQTPPGSGAAPSSTGIHPSRPFTKTGWPATVRVDARLLLTRIHVCPPSSVAYSRPRRLASLKKSQPCRASAKETAAEPVS